MNKYLKNKEGMALPMVLIIMMILTILAAGLGTYASQSFRSVKYMNAQKQAYYLARVGVEAGAYAYQNASLKTSNNYKEFNTTNYDGIDAVVSVLQDATDANDKLIANPGKVTSNKVYVVYAENDTTDGTLWDGLSFVTEEMVDLNAIGINVIGYFTVEASAAANTVLQETENANGTTSKVETDLPVVEFRSTAVCYDSGENEVKNVVSGFVYPADEVDGTSIANDNGVLSTDSDVFDHVTETISIDSGGTVTSNQGDGFFKRIATFFKKLWNGIVKTIYKFITGNDSFTTKVEIYQYSSGGDLIFNAPKNSKSYKLPAYTSGQSGYAYAFASSGTLFLNAGLDVTPDNGQYATIGLFGKDIIVDGDIKMAVYVNNPDYALGGLSNIISTFGNRYRLGTVVIGSGAKSGGDFAEHLSVAKNGITDEEGNTINNANRIFFKGNVSVTVYMQGSKAETYRIFDAGDICLFDGWYKNETTDDKGNKDITYGVDLLKFFVDSVVDKDPVYAHYGESVRKNLEAVREFYYGDQPSYIQKNGNNVKTRPIRVIDVDHNSSIDSTGMAIDKKAITTEVNGVKLLRYIQQPVASQASNINWGKPTNSAWEE
ncbi:MAG: type II secretion system protein [Clostridia bacterium]|nr:type II secretion system protein [Clostridia bacterium]